MSEKKQITNTECLNYSPSVLTEYERQRRFVLRVALTPRPCPMCFEMVNQIEASGKSLDDFNAVNGCQTETYRCPHCQTELKEIVPLIGPVYEWRRKHPWKPEEKKQ